MFSYVASHDGSIVIMVFLFMRTINDGGSLKYSKEDKIYYPIQSRPLRVKGKQLSREERIYFTTSGSLPHNRQESKKVHPLPTIPPTSLSLSSSQFSRI